MTAPDPLAAFRWLSGSENQGGRPLGVSLHDYAAEHSFEYAIDGTVVMGYRLRHPYERHRPRPLNGFMRELGMGLDKPQDDAAWEAAWDDNHRTAVPRGFALASMVTGVPLTPDLLDRPMLVGPIVLPGRQGHAAGDGPTATVPAAWR